MTALGDYPLKCRIKINFKPTSTIGGNINSISDFQFNNFTSTFCKYQFKYQINQYVAAALDINSKQVS